jgi:hypothetical protein
MSLRAILTAHAREATYPAPVAPKGILITVPSEDEEFEPRLQAAPIETSGRMLVIEYSDSKGALSCRRITFRRIEHLPSTNDDGRYYLIGWCHERRALRSFRVDRLLSLMDGRTGEIFEPIESGIELLSEAGFVSRSAPARAPTRSARSLLRDGLKILTFLARCDGAAHPSEMEIIADYCRERAAQVGLGVDGSIIEGILDEADRLYPDTDTFLDAAERAFRDQANGTLLISKARALIIADGLLHEREVQFLRELDALVG